MSKIERTKRLGVIRIRGTVDVRREIEDTLRILRLHKPNHAVVIDDRASYKRMLQKAKDYVTWGEIDELTLSKLIKKRGRLTGNKPVTDDHVSRNSKFKSIEEFSKSLVDFKVEIKDLPSLKPVFRLHPPKKGFEGKKKRAFSVGGELGYRGSKINLLLERMI